MKYFFLPYVMLFFISCGYKKQAKNDIKKQKPLMSIGKNHVATESVMAIYFKEVADWKELKEIDSFFVKFRKISPNEALSNAVELRDLIKNLKDSITPEKFDTPSLNTRINILNNEALRLADLTEIAAIKAADVNKQVDKTMNAFSALNTKINTILAKKDFENEIDIDVKFIGLDSSKMVNVPKKSIDPKQKNKFKYNREIKEQSFKKQ